MLCFASFYFFVRFGLVGPVMLVDSPSWCTYRLISDREKIQLGYKYMAKRDPERLRPFLENYVSLRDHRRKHTPQFEEALYRERNVVVGILSRLMFAKTDGSFESPSTGFIFPLKKSTAYPWHGSKNGLVLEDKFLYLVDGPSFSSLEEFDYLRTHRGQLSTRIRPLEDSVAPIHSEPLRRSSLGAVVICWK